MEEQPKPEEDARVEGEGMTEKPKKRKRKKKKPKKEEEQEKKNKKKESKVALPKMITPLKPPPNIKDYFIAQFKKADSDGTGELDTDEFLNMLQGMLVQLTPPEMAMIHSQVDADNDGSVRWDEFVAVAPQMIRDIYAEKDETEDDADDWCELPADSAMTYWYNKRSGQAMWEKPQVVKDRGPDIKDYLTKKFMAADKDGSGSLEMQEFFMMMKGLLLDLTAKQIHKMYNQIDVDGDGSIMWNEFVLAAPALLRGICAEADMNSDPVDNWIELPGLSSETFWYNKRTSESVRHKPEMVKERERVRGPDVKEYLKKQELIAL